MTPASLLSGKRPVSLALIVAGVLCVAVGIPSIRIKVPSSTCSELNTFHPVGALDCCRGSIAVPGGPGFRCLKRPRAVPSSKPVGLTILQSLTDTMGKGKVFTVSLQGQTAVGNILYHLKRYDILASGESSRKLRALKVEPGVATTLEDPTPSPTGLMSIYRVFAYTQEGQLLARGPEVAVSLNSNDNTAITETAVAAYFERRRNALNKAFRDFLSAKSEVQREYAEETMRNFNTYMRTLSDFETTAIQRTFTQFDTDYRAQLREVFLNVSAPTIEKPEFWAKRGLEITYLFTVKAGDEARAASLRAALARR